VLRGGLPLLPGPLADRLAPEAIPGAGPPRGAGT
jgi:hypothetical protein